VYESCDLHMVLFSGTLVISSHFPCILDFGLILIVDFSLICQFVIYLCSLYIYLKLGHFAGLHLLPDVHYILL
jgi:hypothetical protein